MNAKIIFFTTHIIEDQTLITVVMKITSQKKHIKYHNMKSRIPTIQHLIEKINIIKSLIN